jgi:uncharacterized membrane protein YhaH (DUF805 family)
MNLIDLLLGYRGRIGRGQFWLAVLVYMIVFAIAIGLATFVTGSLSAVIGAAMIAYIPILVSSILVGIKRLHDRNKSPWWLLVFYGIPLALPSTASLFVGIGGDGDDVPAGAVTLQYVSLAVSLWGLIELGAIRGTIGANPHGPDPVAPKPAKH